MASKRQIEANRNNARRSTGPRTDEGKARSSRNALRHGLSRSEADQTNDIVSIKFELARIREARCKLFEAFLSAPDAKPLKRVRGLDRYERKAFSQQRKIIRENGAM